ncbi:RagB/SusD family nutrient uptake outer membrane protein [Pedobacter ginsengisoli]|uniref:RagB/SusD family nutrient uptake outer membrane protein n=1 Tax=Pedobacter ginsengisoli TaxID=363852 RepID=UPI00254FC9E1|nr:RagB/SusD family nutrient uptake outer membrane protein [Pedobacter ginsengisoli]
MKLNNYYSLPKIFQIFLFSFLVTICCSCKKYLDKTPNDKLSVPSSLEDLQRLMDDAVSMNNATVNMGEASSDDYFWTNDMYDALDLIDRHAYTWIYDDYNFGSDWSYSYLPVFNSNFCIESIQKIQKTGLNKTMWDNVIGSALFFRAYHFYNLAGVYGKAYDVNSYEKDLGIVLRLNSDFNIPSLRASIKDTYAQIIKDAEESIGYLPEQPQHALRPSKPAAYGLLARCYLSMRLYDDAYKYADLCLKLKSSLINFNGDPDISINANAPFTKFNKETIFYTNTSGFRKLYAATFALADTNLYVSFKPGDLRKAAYFAPSGKYFKFKGNYTGSASLYFSGIAVDEMLLIRAECAARAGKLTEAMADLNLLLISRWDKNTLYVPVSAGNAKEATDIILAERRKELLFRSIRWTDIKRLNKENYNIIPKRVVKGTAYTLEPNEGRYAMPLPKDIIDITGMPQNQY